MNGADVVAVAGGHGSVGGIAEDDGVDLVGIVFVVVGGGSRFGVGGTRGAGVVEGEMCTSGVLHGIEDRGESSDGGDGGEQDGSGAERLAGGEIEARSGERRDFRRQGLLHRVVLVFPRVGGPAGLAAADSVDGLPRGCVSNKALLVWRLLDRFVHSHECHISKSRYGAPDFVVGFRCGPPAPPGGGVYEDEVSGFRGSRGLVDTVRTRFTVDSSSSTAIK